MEFGQGVGNKNIFLAEFKHRVIILYRIGIVD